MTQSRRVSIIIPTLNRSDLLENCTACLSTEYVIVNEGLPFAEHCNIGAEYVHGDILLFLNDDTEPAEGWLEPIIEAFDDPSVGIVGSRLIYPDGRVQHAGVFLAEPNGILTAYNVLEDLPSRNVEAVTGACLAIRRDLFAELGGFDEGFVNGYEDVDLCLRVRRDGWQVRYVAESTVVHHESQSGAARWTHVHQNIERLQERWADRWQSLPLLSSPRI
jgi:GT2 family glycosyltransferase